MLRIEKIFSYLQSKQCVFSFLICLPALFLIMSPLWAAGAPQQTVITVQGAPTQQNPSGLEQKLVTIPDSSKLQINPVNSTTPSSITVNAPKPLNLNPALSWGPSTDPFYNGKAGAPVCGGYWNGKLQPKCPPSPATFVAEAVGVCPAGSFVDIGAGGCFTCPDGFNRTGDAVTSATACSKLDSSVALRQMSAKFAGSLCPAGSFFDPIHGGQCYSCPAGYKRSAAHIDAPNACFIPAGERFARAKRTLRTIWPHDCKGGSFHDAWDGGGCWTCPAGYRRTGNHIADANACVQSISEQQARATLQGKAECKTGEFLDLRNGFECWSCPTGTYRTVHPVNGNQACEQRAGVQLSKAVQVSAFSCPADTFLDLISSKEPIVRQRIEKQIVETGKRVSYGNSAGGTCWTCPPGYIRDIYHVAGNAACKTSSIKWQPAPYTQPGLFGLAGANEVARAVISDGRELETLIAALAKDTNTPLEVTRKNVYDEIAHAPQASAILSIAVYKRIVATVQNPAQATPDEKRLVASFAEAIRLYRIFVAQNALDMYDQWSEALMRQAADAAQKAGPSSIEQQRLNQLAFKGGEVPPEFKEIAVELTAANVLAPMAMQSFLIASKTMPTLRNAIFPSARKSSAIANQLGKASQEAVERMTGAAVKNLSEKVASKAASKVLNQILGASMKAGPQIVIGIMIESMTAVIEFYATVVEARPKLVADLAGAKQPVDMLRELNADENWLFSQWAMVLGSGEWAPDNQSTFAQLAGASAAKTAPTPVNAPKVWLQMPGAATDIGMGANTLWSIGTQATQGGFSIYRWDGKNWVDMKGAGVKLDVDNKGFAWAITDKDEIYRYNNSGWTKLSGLAKDIGIGSDGSAWIIGSGATNGGFEIFKFNNGNWIKIPGGGVRIDVDPKGNAWVISKDGDVFRYVNNVWLSAPGVKANDIGIGADGSVFITAQDSSVYRWNGQSWIKRDGKLSAITVDTQGVPFGISDNKQIWMGYP